MRFFLVLFSFFLLFSCATITRKDVVTQKLVVKDNVSKKGIADVKVQMNGQDVGRTNKNGVITYPIGQKNKPDEYLLTLTHDSYVPLKLTIKNRVGGGYLAGDIALFLLGGIPGVVGIVVDAVTGEWYSYKNNLTVEMNTK